MSGFLPAEAAFAATLAASGIDPGGQLVIGTFTRCGTTTKPRSRDGRYIFHLDGVPAGGYQNMAGDSGWQTWCSKGDGDLSTVERAAHRARMVAARRQADEARAEDAADARKRSAQLMRQSQPASPDHPYLERKGIQPHGARQHGDRLVVPLFDVDGVLHTTQTIGPDGVKLFAAGGVKRGHFFPIGEIAEAEMLLIGEGLATVASAIEAVAGAPGLAAIVAFDAGNLLPVAEALHARHPGKRIVLLADDDIYTPERGNKGLASATAAADTVGGVVVVPDFGDVRQGAKLTDFNDLHAARGLSAVRAQLEGAIAQGVPLCAKSAPTLPNDANDEYDASERPSPLAPPVSVDVATEKKARIPAADLAIAHAKVIGIELFHDKDRRAFLSFAKKNGGRETVTLSSGACEMFIREAYFNGEGRALGSSALETAKATLEAEAIFRGRCQEVHVRIAEHAGCIYLDLADERRHAARIDTEEREGGRGWEVIPDPPVRFVRPPGMLPLPLPMASADGPAALARFTDLLNLDRQDAILILAWLVATLRPAGPYPVLALSGEAGSAKSTATELLRTLVDPNRAPIRAMQKDEMSVVLAARNGLILALDNLSYVAPETSDILCRIATGAGISARKLYTDDEEAIINVCRPIVLNGIGEVTTRGDLIDRSVSIRLPVISEGTRRTKAEVMGQFSSIHPVVLGALLDGAAGALQNAGNIRLDRPPRMADFAAWVSAAAPALGFTHEEFMSAYRGNVASGRRLSLEASPVFQAVTSAVGDRTLKITASELLERINSRATESERRSVSWPHSSKAMGETLRRLAPAMREGWGNIEESNRTSAARLWVIGPPFTSGDGRQDSSFASPASLGISKPSESRHFPPPDRSELAPMAPSVVDLGDEDEISVAAPGVAQ